MATVSEAATEKSYTRPLLATDAVVAWLGVAISFTLTISGYYLGSEKLDKQSILGNVPSGHDSPLERIIDWSTYFTIISAITVAVVLTVLMLRPALFTREDRVGGIWRALRLDSVLMIVITGIFYWLLLAEGRKIGWDLVDSTILHTVTPDRQREWRPPRAGPISSGEWAMWGSNPQPAPCRPRSR